MATTPDYTILSSPRVSAATFASILRANGSPAYAEAAAEYRAFVAAGVDPTVGLAVFRKESSMGRAGRATGNRSWGNIREPSGAFRHYSSWTAGAADAARLLGVYGRNQIRPGRKTDTVQTFPYVWAPSSDGNAPDKYGDSLAAWIRQWSGMTGNAPGTAPPPEGKTVSSPGPGSNPADLLGPFLASIGRKASDPIRDSDVIPFVQYLQGLHVVPSGSPNNNPLVSAFLESVKAKVGQPWSSLGPALLEDAVKPNDPLGLVGAFGGLVAGLGDVLIHAVILVGILALLGMGAWLVATSED